MVEILNNPSGTLQQKSAKHKFLEKYYSRYLEKLQKGILTPEQVTAKLVAIHEAKERKSQRDKLLKKFLNQEGFPKTLEAELELIQKTNLQKGTLLYLDIDNFKRFNDTKGHPEGDRLIKLYGKAIMESTRETDLLGRIGGDELAVFLVGTNIEGAKIVAERIRENIIQTVKGKLTDLPFEQTVSIGVAQVSPEDNVEIISKKADIALYQAKNAGKNQIKVSAD